MKQLIVAADDFGLTGSVNAGIVKAHEEGIVTFLNAIPAGDAFDDALRRAGALGLKEIGAHLALTETAPVSSPAKIPSLVRADGAFHRDHIVFLLKFFLRLIRPDEIFEELKSQIDRLKSAGIPITNVSSHEHVHLFPGILPIFVRLAEEYKIPSIRFPHRDVSMTPRGVRALYRSSVLGLFVKEARRVLGKSALRSTDHFAGFLDSGGLTESKLLAIVSSLPDGTTELVCHPGFLGPEVLDRYPWHLGCEEELSALTSRRVQRRIETEGIRLAGYKEFLS